MAITLKRSSSSTDKIQDWTSERDASAYFDLMRASGKHIVTTYGEVNGKPGNGDLTNPAIIEWLRSQYGDKSGVVGGLGISEEAGGADLITADGGIDASKDYNAQEMLNAKLIYSEIVNAITNQKVGGTFVLKVFDLYTDLSIQYLQLLEYFYETVHVSKPLTSRLASSEKYVVAQVFKGWPDIKSKTQIVGSLIQGIDEWNTLEKSNLQPDKPFAERGFYVTSIMVSPLLSEFQNVIKENNDRFMERQMKKIDEGLDLIKSKKIYNKESQISIKTSQRPIAFKWCQEYLKEDSCNTAIKIEAIEVPSTKSKSAKPKESKTVTKTVVSSTAGSEPLVGATIGIAPTETGVAPETSTTVSEETGATPEETGAAPEVGTTGTTPETGEIVI